MKGKGTINNAIIEVLKLEGKPLSAKNIHNRIIELDFYRFRAENPVHIVLTQLRRHCEGLDFSTAKKTKHFQLLKDGTYWLKDVPIPGRVKEKAIKDKKKSIVKNLKELHENYTKNFKQSILSQLKEIEPETFELFSKKLLEVYGFKDLKVTKTGRDGGIDGYGKLRIGISYLNVAFQCKRWKNTTISRIEIDKFRGATQGDFEQGIFFTTSKFSKEALKATTKKGAIPIILVDGLTILDIMIEKKFGINIEDLPIYINALDEVLPDE